MDAFDIADLVELKVEYRNDAGVLTDPTAPTIKIRTPAGVLTSYTYITDSEMQKSDTGIYHVNYTPAATGYHSWGASATGAVQAAETSGFYVRRPV